MKGHKSDLTDEGALELNTGRSHDLRCRRSSSRTTSLTAPGREGLCFPYRHATTKATGAVTSAWQDRGTVTSTEDGGCCVTGPWRRFSHWIFIFINIYYYYHVFYLILCVMYCKLKIIFCFLSILLL